MMFLSALRPTGSSITGRTSLVGSDQFQFITYDSKSGLVYFIRSNPANVSIEQEKASVYACDPLFPDEPFCVQENVFTIPHNAEQCNGTLSEDGQTFGLLYSCESSTLLTQVGSRTVLEPSCVVIFLNLADFTARRFLIRRGFYRNGFGYEGVLGHTTQLGWFIFPYWFSDHAFPAHLPNLRVYGLRERTDEQDAGYANRISNSLDVQQKPVEMFAELVPGTLMPVGGRGVSILADGHFVKLSFMGAQSVHVAGRSERNLLIWQISSLDLHGQTEEQRGSSPAEVQSAHNMDGQQNQLEFYLTTSSLCLGRALVPMQMKDASNAPSDCLVSLQLDDGWRAIQGYRVINLSPPATNLFSEVSRRWKVVYLADLGRALLIHANRANRRSEVTFGQVPVDQPFKLKELCTMRLQRQFGRLQSSVLISGLDRRELLMGRLKVGRQPAAAEVS